MEHIVNLCNENNKIVGTFIGTIEETNKWKEAGIRYLAHSVDVSIIYDKFSDIIYKFNKGRS